MSGALGQRVSQPSLDEEFLSVPGEDLVLKTLLQFSKVPAFVKLFGPYKPGSDQQRWADYNKFDWSIRQLPAINVYRAESDSKDSDQAWVRGTVNVQVFWPPNLRRGDLALVPDTFLGIILNFFASQYVRTMLDELYYIQRPEKVYGLNEYGKMIDRPVNIEGIVEDELVPVTLIGVRYRIYLRSWYRALEFMNRTKDQPFQDTLSDLTKIGGTYEGVTDTEAKEQIVAVPDEITVHNP
jgi:hypothetical protein